MYTKYNGRGTLYATYLRKKYGSFIYQFIEAVSDALWIIFWGHEIQCM